MIRGINHITLAVRQRDVSLAFYVELLGCRLLARWPQGAYLLAGQLWLALIVDPATRSRPLPEYTHLALDVSPEDFVSLADQLIQARVPIWKDNQSEGDSLYFLDPDGHKLEIHASTLNRRLVSAVAQPWEGFELLIDPAELKWESHT
ncbi:MAG: glutathione transferase [Candidatus Melainabacteria bacterium HGW-Melainabacteria-1]|nr:MAG: glutathione transferase [Candidatus Melainabacteria bacterium HGW-Melainabacteria-1]